MKEELYILKKGKLNIGPKEGRVPSYGDPSGHPTGEPAPSLPESTMGKGESGDKPFHGYNKDKHSPTGGLNAKFREKYNREHGSNLKAPVTESNPTGKKAARKRSFCARMSGIKGPTSKDGKLTPKGAALKRWKCSKSEEYYIDDNSSVVKAISDVCDGMNNLVEKLIKGE